MLRGTGFGTFPRGISAVLDSEPCDEARVVRDVVFDGEVHPTPVLRRSGLRGELAGPAIVVEETATTVIPPRLPGLGGRQRIPDHQGGRRK